MISVTYREISEERSQEITEKVCKIQETLSKSFHVGFIIKEIFFEGQWDVPDQKIFLCKFKSKIQEG